MIETMLLEHMPVIQSFAAKVAVSGIAVCTIVLTIARLLSRRSEPLRYGILLIGVVALLASPGLVGLGQLVPAAWLWTASEPAEEVVAIPAEILPELFQARVPDPVIEPAQGETAALTPLGPGIAATVVCLWGLGVVFGVGRLGRAFVKQRRIVLGKRWNSRFWTEECKSQLAAKLGLRNFPEVYHSPVAAMPMVLGFWRPTILLPQPPPAEWTQAQWEAVLLHEAAHVARRDHWAALAQRVAVILFWWCPLAHLLGRRLNDLREKICDDCALQGRCDRVGYAELLLETAEHFLRLKTLPVPLGLLASARGGLEARITRLLAQEKRPMTKLSRSGKFLGGAVLIGACLLTTAGTAISWGQPPAEPQRKVQIKIIVDGKEIDLSDARIPGLIEAGQSKPGTAAKPVEVRVHAVQDGPVTAHPERVLSLVQAAPQERAEVPQKADARIEDLIRQAEAIKPGSGAAVRRALQGDARLSFVYEKRVDKPMMAVPETVLRGHLPALVAVESAPGQYRVSESTGGKKIVILAVEDGKVRQLSEDELKKFVDKGGHSIVLERTTTKSEPKVLDVRREPVPARIVETKPPQASSPQDMEAIRRQLERLSHELNELRSRLEAGKKGP